MKIWVGKRGEGKTTRLIKESARTGIPIMAYWKVSVRYIKRRAQEIGVEIPEPFDFKQKAYGSVKTNVLVDDIDMVIRNLLDVAGYKIVGGTLDMNENNIERISENKDVQDKGPFDRLEVYRTVGNTLAISGNDGTLIMPVYNKDTNKMIGTASITFPNMVNPEYTWALSANSQSRWNGKAIKQIYTDGTTTVVKFADGEQVKVKCGEGEEPNTYTAVCAAIAKKLYGSNSALKREIVEKTVWQEKKTKKERKS
jgi:hypothetical protein